MKKLIILLALAALALFAAGLHDGDYGAGKARAASGPIVTNSVTPGDGGIQCNYTWWGTPYADTKQGNTYNDCFYGQGGNDALYGNGGNDYLSGNCGDDTLWGGSGNDTLIAGCGGDLGFVSGGEGNDTIYFDDGWFDASYRNLSCGGGYDVVFVDQRDLANSNAEPSVYSWPQAASNPDCEQVYLYLSPLGGGATNF